MLNFVKCFFCFWVDQMCLLHFVNLIDNNYWFAYFESPWPPWNKPHLIMVSDPFTVLLNSVCYLFLSNFAGWLTRSSCSSLTEVSRTPWLLGYAVYEQSNITPSSRLHTIFSLTFTQRLLTSGISTYILFVVTQNITLTWPQSWLTHFSPKKTQISLPQMKTVNI